MSVKNTATLTTDNATIIGSQIAPDTITPTTDAGQRQDVIDSMMNKSDQVVDSLGTTLTQFVLDLINANAQVMSGPAPYLFRASKTADQLIVVTAGTTTQKIFFEDDSTAPNFDTSNLFYINEFVAIIPMQKTFSLESVRVKFTGGTSAETYRLIIRKNGVEIATGDTFTNNGTMVDVYGNLASSANGFMFPHVIARDVTMIAGDVITAELVCNYVSATTPKLVGGVFSNA